MTDGLEYAAGLFDARGTITLWKPSTYNWKSAMVRIAVGEKRWPVLEYLKETFGGCVTNYSGNRKCWQIGNTKAVEFLKAIRPITKVPKRQEQIDYILGIPRFDNIFCPTKQEIKARKAFEKGWKRI